MPPVADIKDPCPTCGCTRQHWAPKTRDHPMPALRQYRLNRGWTIKFLANKAGVAINTLWSLENGYHNAKISTAKLIADALGVAVADIIDPSKPRITPKRTLVRAINLHKYRLERGYSVRGLGRRAGVDKTTMYNISAGGSSSIPTMQKVAEALDITIEELIGGSCD